MIELESLQILNADVRCPALVAQNYLCRAESYLLIGDFDRAHEDFQQGCLYATQCDDELKKSLLVRGHFGLAIVYGSLEMMEDLYSTIDSLLSIFSFCDCNSNRSFTRNNDMSFRKMHGTKPIYGPNTISVQDCLQFAEGTARNCRYLISLVPKAHVQVTLNILVDDLLERARRCCKAGGIWKTCLQPIVDKWQLWNEKWNLLRIPPDPAWD